VNARRLLLLGAQAVLLALAAWAAWPGPQRQWHPFSAPELVEVQFPGGTGVSADVWSSQGRIGARRDAVLVFRWLEQPVSLEVEDTQGAVELSLGGLGGSNGLLALTDTGATFSVARSGRPAQTLSVAHVQHAQLAYADGNYVARVDGRAVGQPVPGPEPGGPALVRLAQNASFAAMECGMHDGESRRVQGEAPVPGLQQLAWALLAGLLGLLCLNAWVPMVGSQRAPGAAGRAAACVAALALVAGIAWTLHADNVERLTTVPERCEELPLSLPDARAVAPGEPYPLGERRDGDFTLRATVVLEPETALDLLVRAGLPRTDRQVLVTLSSDARLAGGVSRNLGTFLATTPAAPELACLPAGRPLALEVICHDERTDVRVDGKPFASVADVDLRAGRCAFHALSGRATVSELALVPAGQPRALDGTLHAWEAGAAGAAALALLFLALRGGRGLGSLLWCWPLAAVVAPFAAAALALPALVLAGLLLLLTPRPGRRVLTWVAGALLIGLTWWAQSESAPPFSPTVLTQLMPTDFTGPPIDARYVWARHPLCRRFNGYLKDQTFRDAVVPREKPADTLRIVTLGSSSTYGYGVAPKDTWSAQAQVLLAHLWPARGVEVVNAGVPGGTAERLRFFLTGVVLDLHPDAVVIDLSFNDHILGGTHDERAHFAAMTSEGVGPLDRWLAAWRAQRQRRGWQRYVETSEQGRSVSDADVERYSVGPARRFGDSIRDMVDACRAAGVAVLLVEEPTRPGENPPAIGAFHREMAAIGSERGVPVVAPQADLDAVGGDLFIDAVHPNRDGHRIIARVVGSGLAALLRPGR